MKKKYTRFILIPALKSWIKKKIIFLSKMYLHSLKEVLRIKNGKVRVGQQVSASL